MAEDSEVTVIPPVEMDLSTIEPFRDQLHSIDPSSVITVDMTDVTFCYSTGLGAIAGAVQRAREAEGIIVVRNPKPQVRRVLEISQLDHYVIIEYDQGPQAEQSRKPHRSRNYGDFL